MSAGHSRAISHMLSPREQCISHVLYNAGRVATYALIGGTAGLMGEIFNLAARLRGSENLTAFIGGTLMVILGVTMLGLAPRPGVLTRNPFASAEIYRRTFGKLLTANNPMGRLALGAGMGFVPCALLYSMVAKASASATFLSGMLTLLSFGLGTAPSLLLAGVLSSVVGVRVPHGGERLSAVAIALMGLVLLWRAISSQAPGAMPHGT